MFCEYCGKQLNENELCDCPDAILERNIVEDEKTVTDEEPLFCEYCGRKLNKDRKCVHCEFEETDSGVAFDTLKKEMPENENSMLFVRDAKKKHNVKVIIGMIIAIVLLVGVCHWLLSAGQTKEIQVSTDINGELNKETSVTQKEYIKISADGYFTVDNITEENRIEIYDLTLSYMKERLKEDNVDEDSIFCTKYYLLERKADVDNSDYNTDVENLTQNKVIILGEYYNNSSGKMNYWKKTWDGLHVVNGEIAADNDYSNLQFSSDPFETDFVDSFSEYYEITIDLRYPEIPENTVDRMEHMIPYTCNNTEISVESKIYIAVSDDEKTLSLLDKTGFLDFEMNYYEEYSDTSCKVFCSGEDGVVLYNKIKNAGKENLVYRYKHLDGLTSEQVEKCSVKVIYYPAENYFEFVGLGPFEFYNGVYKIESETLTKEEDERIVIVENNTKIDEDAVYATVGDFSRSELQNYERFVYEKILNYTKDDTPTIGISRLNFLYKNIDAPEIDSQGNLLPQNKFVYSGFYYDKMENKSEWIFIIENLVKQEDGCQVQGNCYLIFGESVDYMAEHYSDDYTTESVNY